MRAYRPRSRFRRVARFIYLNRTCFNGIYRVNLKGQFNVPMGTKVEVSYSSGYLERVSKLLKTVQLQVADFEETIECAGYGDFVYVDPPYTVMHNNNNFVKYNDVLFSWKDQQRLAAAVRQCIRRGAQVLVWSAMSFSLGLVLASRQCSSTVSAAMLRFAPIVA